jgi:DNA repair exonuclease SbcCD nuclease subunit
MSDSFKIKGKYIGCFSDIHIGLYQNNDQWHKIALDFAEWASSAYLKLGINDIIIPGDVFHNRNEIGVNTLSIAKKFFDHFKDFRIFISSGNHDCFYKNNSTVNSISILDGWNNIHIIDKTPTRISTDYGDIVLVPWGIEYENIPETKGILFGHFEINSFYMNSYKVCDHGLESKQLFKKSATIVSGHFHKKSHRKYENGQILYLGSPYQQNFGDVGDERGIYILNLENHEFNFIENKISPKHLKISLKDYDKNKSLDSIKNNIVSLIVDQSIDQEILSNYTSNIQKEAPLSFRTDYLESDLSIKSIDSEKESNTGDILKDIEEFVNNLEIEHKKEVVDYLTEAYNILLK